VVSIERLRAWAEAGSAVEVAEHGDGWELRLAGSEAAPPVRVRLSAKDITVDLEAWSRTWERDEDGEAEVVDLVAALWFGRARVDIEERGGRWVRWRLEVLVDGRWREAVARSRWRLPFTATQRVVRRHVLPEPADLRWGEAGRLPFARWIGMVVPADAGVAKELPVDGELDLHPFAPKEVGEVVRQYLDECVRRGVWQLRLVHGKGIGNLRRTVHAILAKHPAVESYRLGGHGEGSWGATVVTLKRAPRSPAGDPQPET
jgi:hypothetical protein